jgi:glycine/D-amino acid oxidase-like deaminating enzyme
MREPALLQVPATAAYSPDDLGIDPIAYTRSLLLSAQQAGATIRPHTLVLALLTSDDRVQGVLTDQGEIVAESVVLAAGTGSTKLAETVGVDVDIAASPCCLLSFSTPRPLVRGILSTPDFEARQLDGNTLLVAEDVPPGFAGDPAEIASNTLEVLRAHLRGAEDVRSRQAVIADRPIPAGGQSILGPARGVPGLYLAVAHPAVILSAAIGRQVANDHNET